jgi:SAM-dependent methyltransferase
LEDGVPAAFRPDIERLRSVNGEQRSPDRLQAHYVIERELAARLRGSAPDQRNQLYGEVYGELFARLPDHPQHKMDPARRRRNTENQVAFLRGQLRPADVYVEMGCGDAAVTRAVSPFVREAIGVDVTPALIDAEGAPENFRFVKTSGTDIGLPSDYADLVYSNQLMEHLHPDDALAQLGEIHRVLKPGGRYICVTPSRITGPHDISAYFGYEPAGFHLREYDHASLAALFRQAGFGSAVAHLTVKGRHVSVPVAVAVVVEKVLMALPHAARLRITQIGPVRNLAGVTLIGRK